MYTSLFSDTCQFLSLSLCFMFLAVWGHLLVLSCIQHPSVGFGVLLMITLEYCLFRENATEVCLLSLRAKWCGLVTWLMLWLPDSFNCRVIFHFPSSVLWDWVPKFSLFLRGEVEIKLKILGGNMSAYMNLGFFWDRCIPSSAHLCIYLLYQYGRCIFTLYLVYNLMLY